MLDTGALIGFERGDREVAALIEAVRRRRERVLTSSGCVAQAWRRGGPRQALLGRLLSGVEEIGFGPEVSRRVGELCAEASSSDVIDVHISILAGQYDLVLTSDVEDLGRLLRARRSTARVRRC